LFVSQTQILLLGKPNKNVGYFQIIERRTVKLHFVQGKQRLTVKNQRCIHVHEGFALLYQSFYNPMIKSFHFSHNCAAGVFILAKEVP